MLILNFGLLVFLSTASRAGSDAAVRSHRMRTPSPILALLAGTALSAAVVQLTTPVRVVDGDTIDVGYRIAIEKARYRIDGLDAPETRGAKCPEERALGKAAANRLRQLAAGGNVSVSVLGRPDKYGRQIASVTLGGHDAAETLIAEGLARPYSGGKRAPWCPDPPPH